MKEYYQNRADSTLAYAAGNTIFLLIIIQIITGSILPGLNNYFLSAINKISVINTKHRIKQGGVNTA